MAKPIHKGKGDATDKKTVNIRLDPTTKDKLEHIVSERFPNQRELLQRLVAWYVRQPTPLQTAITSHLDDEAFRMCLEWMLRESEDRGLGQTR